MAIRSGFFNSINKDRLYSASNFAEYFATFISNGVFPNPSDNLQVISNNDMTVTVQAGKAWINGYILINDDDYILEIEPADGVLNRIDRIVARYDVVDREIRLEVKKGQFSSNPVAPNLQRDADAYELALADIYVAKGAVSIAQANITDLRFNTELCGIVKGTVDQIDTTDLFAQYQAAFNDWFQELKDVLDDNTAANFLNLINQLDDDLASHKADYANLVDRVNNLNTNDIQARKEILDIKLKLDEQQVIDFLNKTGIGFYDLFEDSDNIDIANTTAVVDTAVADVIFNGQQTLKMKPQTFDNFNTLELALYYKGELKTLEMENNVSNSAQIDMMISPGSIAVGEKYYYNGEVYTVIGVQEV
jgi:hypothetical protein